MINPAEIQLLSLPFVSLEQKNKLPKEPSIYFAIDSVGQVQYIGQSINPKQRWGGHHKYDELSQLSGVRIAYLTCDKYLLNEVESALIAWFNPPLNKSELLGRRKGFSPINGEGGTMRQKQFKVSLPAEDMDWLELQPNQSETIRQAIALYRQNITSSI